MHTFSPLFLRLRRRRVCKLRGRPEDTLFCVDILRIKTLTQYIGRVCLGSAWCFSLRNYDRFLRELRAGRAQFNPHHPTLVLESKRVEHDLENVLNDCLNFAHGLDAYPGFVSFPITRCRQGIEAADRGRGTGGGGAGVERREHTQRQTTFSYSQAAVAARGLLRR